MSVEPGRWEGKAPGPRAARAYAIVSLAVAAAGGALALGFESGGRASVVTGVGAAWLIQAGAFRRLALALWSGQPVLRPWIGGIAARVAGLAAAFVAGETTPLDATELLLSYGLTAVGLLLLEAAWLAVAGPTGSRSPVTGGKTPTGRSAGRSNDR